MDTIQAALSDTHSGSNYALFVKRHWKGTKGNTHSATSTQVRIRERWEKYADEVKHARKGKRLVIVHNGDAIDGDHHNSNDVCTRNPLEQADIHIELMTEFQKRVNWQRGDKIYYTRGTQTHVNEMENYIGREVNAEMDGEFYVHDLLRLETNGVMSWFVHHGPGAGNGANEGNALRAWLKNIHYDAVKDGSKMPSIVYTGHVHNPTWQPYGYRIEMKFYEMHGIILPSWQAKTTFAWQVAAASKNKIGGVFQEIKSDGTVCIPVFSVDGYK